MGERGTRGDSRFRSGRGLVHPRIEYESHPKCNWKSLKCFKKKNYMMFLSFSNRFVGTWKAQK